MNDLSDALNHQRGSSFFTFEPIPNPIIYILFPLLFISFAISLLVLVAVHNAIFFICILLLSSLLLSFLLWNSFNFANNGGLLFFVSRFPDSDLRTAKDGQLVKITGLSSCGSLALESSYEKVSRCIYTSTHLYKYRGIGSKLTNVNSRCFKWSLVYSERFTADFFITDSKSGMRATVKAGHDSKVIPLIADNILVHTTSRTTVLSSCLRKWLRERNLSPEACLVRLEEGYVKEGSFVTVLGVLHRNNGVAAIVQPPEPFSTRCLWRKFLLPVDIDGLVLRLPDRISSELAP